MTSVDINLDDNDEISYDYYKTRLLDGHEDLQLGANYLTNQQLFWMALARKFYIKFQPNLPKNIDPVGKLQTEFMHLVYKSQPGFQEAFQCNLTDIELIEYDKYLKLLRNL